MVLYLVGLGLGDPEDISVKALKAIKTCSRVYLQFYTSIMSTRVPLIEADRQFCEIGIDKVLEQLSKEKQTNYAFLVVGDPFCATTHSDLYLRATELGIQVKVMHNASIVSAVGCCGLMVYRFGEIVSLPLWKQNWKPNSFYQKIASNRKANLHTLVLLDIKVKERTDTNIMLDKKIYQPPRYMTIKEGVTQLLESIKTLEGDAYDSSTPCFGLARIGYPDQKVVSAPLGDFLDLEMGSPLHSFVICAPKLHSVEEKMYEHFKK